ncbi:porin [Brachymonas denitrificans]|uniref:porin n=1 Tax=Brachymonas denitrificans TaxID=28220 RepID=UPI0032202CBD
MKKSLIAIAALAAVGAASAQSSVTLYGLADVYAGQAKSTDVTPTTKTVTKETGFNSGGLQGSRVGVKGVEDLGNGLKAVFNYEMGFNAINGDTHKLSQDKETKKYSLAGGFNRRAVVGLQGGFGSVLLGTDYTPLYNLISATEADAQSTFDTGNLSTGYGGGFTPRISGVHYAGNFSGVGVQASYGYGKTTVTETTDTSLDKSQSYALGLSYANGPFMIGAAGQQIKGTTGANGVDTTAKTTEYGVGGSYDFGAAKLFANYLYSKKQPSTTVATYSKADEANIGVLVPFGAASVVAEYGHNRYKGYVAGVQTEKAKGNDWLIGANYAFSKRTDVYARAGRSGDATLKNMDGVELGKVKGENYAVGLRHKF